MLFSEDRSADLFSLFVEIFQENLLLKIPNCSRISFRHSKTA